MRKRIISIGLAICLLLGLTPGAWAAGLEVAAPSAILMDAATGTILWEKDAHTRLAPASVTKIMTLLLVLEALDSGKIGWDDTVTASDAAAAKGGSQVYLEPGEQLPLRDMLKAVVVSSANDCATALAEHVAGSEAAFVELMNQRAAELGMQETHFVNCTGLDDEPDAAEHLTSAYDIAVMSRQLLQHEEIRQYTTIWMDTVRDGQFGLSNTNKLIRFYQGATGLKTGYTAAAGHCLSASAQRNGIELIAVVLHCASSADRFTAAKALLDYGFANYALVQLETDGITPLPVKLGDRPADPHRQEPAGGRDPASRAGDRADRAHRSGAGPGAAHRRIRRAGAGPDRACGGGGSAPAEPVADPGPPAAASLPERPGGGKLESFFLRAAGKTIAKGHQIAYNKLIPCENVLPDRRSGAATAFRTGENL